MGLLGSRNKKEERVILFDVGSSSIGCTYVHYKHPGHAPHESLSPDKEKDTRPRVLFSDRLEIPFQKEMDFERFIELTMTTLDEVATRLESQHLGAPTRVVCVLGTPWYSAQTRRISLAQKTPFTFSHRFADGVIAKEVALFRKKQVDEFIELADDNTTLLEKKVVEVRLNGYPVRRPIGKKTRTVEMSLFLSIAPKDILDQIEARLQKFFHHKVEFHSFLFSAYTAIRHAFPYTQDYVLVDVGGDLTECAVVRNDVVSESHSFPHGSHMIIREICSSLNKTPPEALSLMKMYTHDLSDEQTREEVSRALGPISEKWSQHIAEIFSHLSKTFLLPERVFVTANRNMLPWFTDALSQEAFHRFTFTHKKFDVLKLDPSTLHGFCVFGDDVERDASLMMETLFFDHILKHQRSIA